MTTSLTLAAADGPSIPDPLSVLIGVAAVGYVLWSRIKGQPLGAKRLLVLPVVLTVLGMPPRAAGRGQNLGSGLDEI